MRSMRREKVAGALHRAKGDLVEFGQLPTAHSKCGLGLVLLGDGHLPVPTLEVQGGEPFGPMESV